MLRAIEGTYKNGEVQLTEPPQDIAEGRVIVTFLETISVKQPKNMMRFGMFAGARQSTEEDFQVSEFADSLQEASDEH